MGALLVIGAIAVVLVAASALGMFWAPLLLAIAFGAWGLLLVVSGLHGGLAMFGIGFIALAALELASAFELYGEPDPGIRSSWRLGSAVIGLVGSAAAIASLAVIAAGITAALFI